MTFEPSVLLVEDDPDYATLVQQGSADAGPPDEARVPFAQPATRGRAVAARCLGDAGARTAAGPGPRHQPGSAPARPSARSTSSFESAVLMKSSCRAPALSAMAFQPF